MNSGLLSMVIRVRVIPQRIQHILQLITNNNQQVTASPSAATSYAEISEIQVLFSLLVIFSPKIPNYL